MKFEEQMKVEKEMQFEKELEMLINKHIRENEADTPSFILTQYLKGCLANYAETVKARDKWYTK
jgi:bifunctional ADP-heptose synthase (sugar kinase/adenylyltransferase)